MALVGAWLVTTSDGMIPSTTNKQQNMRLTGLLNSTLSGKEPINISYTCRECAFENALTSSTCAIEFRVDF